MGKPLNDAAIDALIAADKIVIASCPARGFKGLHGKFVKGKPDASGAATYAFRPFRRGVDLPFLPAGEWNLEEKGSVPLPPLVPRKRR